MDNVYTGPNMTTRELIEAEGSTLVIHKDDRSTDFLKDIYSGKGYKVITGGIGKRSLYQEIQRHSRIFMLGHGSPGGLFGPGYIIGDEFGPILAEKSDGLYIWCHADEYARPNKLTGLVSGMFISEVGEARMNGIEASQREVDASNKAFALAVREYLETGAAPATVREKYSSTTCEITKFNSSRLYVFSNGVSSPASVERTSTDWSFQDPRGHVFRDEWRQHASRELTGPYGHDRLPDEFDEIETNPLDIDEDPIVALEMYRDGFIELSQQDHFELQKKARAGKSPSEILELHGEDLLYLTASEIKSLKQQAQTHNDPGQVTFDY